MSYGNQEYGSGGGSGAGANYYDQNQDFSGRDSNHGNQGNQNYGRQEIQGNYGRQESQGNYGRQENQSNYGNQGNDSYGRQESHGNQSYGRQESQGNYGNDNYNSNSGSNHNQGGYGQQESHGRRNSGNYGDDDFSSAANHAQEHHGSEDKSLFSSALSFINERKSQYSGSGGEVDEQHAVKAHQEMYGSGSSSGNHDSNTVGAGAAMQALKMFTGGGSGGSSSDGGMDKNKLIGLAMAQAGKLWDEKQGSGANVSGDKQSAVNSAAEMALKMYMKSQGGGVGGTGGAGGASGLLSLASKFL
ncbi:unnamed protein product [Penicillium bialowiezense]